MNVRPWKAAEFFVHWVYLSTMFMNGALFLFLPGDRLSYGQYRTLFLTLIAIMALTAPAVYFVYRRWLGTEALKHVHRTTGHGPACRSFMLGTILMTCLGDSSGILGASFFTFTRDSRGLVFFLAGWAAQYALTTWWVARGKEVLNRLLAETEQAYTIPAKSAGMLK